MVNWPRFLELFAWTQGEHVTIIGPTGSGKSWLATLLLGIRSHVVVFGTKPRDETLETLERRGFRRITTWPPPALRTHVLLWPRFRKVSDEAEQRDTFRHALEEIFATGRWCVYADELPYLVGRLRLADLLELLWLQGRALRVSLVAAAQRPAWLPLAAYSQATHLFLYRPNEERDLKRLAEIGGAVDTTALRELVRRLPPHAFAYVNTRTGRVLVSRAPDPHRR